MKGKDTERKKSQRQRDRQREIAGLHCDEGCIWMRGKVARAAVSRSQSRWFESIPEAEMFSSHREKNKLIHLDM